jgi:hypothetical protein
MKAFYTTVALLLASAAFVSADDFDLSENIDSAETARLFFVNFTSSLVQVNATILAYGLLFLAVVGAAAVALYYLYLESQSSSGGYGSYGQNYQNYNYNYAR